MNTQPKVEIKSLDAGAAKRVISGETVVGCAVLGCLFAGTIGVLKALSEQGVDAAACLLASVAAFGMVTHIYLRKSFLPAQRQ